MAKAKRHRAIPIVLAAAIIAVPAIAPAQTTPTPPAAAQEATPGSPQAPSAEALAIATELVELTVTRTLVEDMAGHAWLPLAEGLKHENPTISDEMLAELRTEFLALQVKVLGDLFSDLPAVYARHFTTDELSQLLAFNKTPVGQKALVVMPKIMAETMPRLMGSLDATMPLLLQRFREKVREKGLKMEL